MLGTESGMIELSNHDFWYRYSRDAASAATMGIVPVEWQVFRARTSAGDRRVRSMLSIYELSLLYALARRHYSGAGYIVDAGPLLGAPIFALCQGLEANTGLASGEMRSRILSYDLFSAHGYQKFLGDLVPASPTGTLLPEYLALIVDHLDKLAVHQGDFTAWAWPGEPVEIMLLDLAKSWHLNHHSISQYFPCLIGNKSILTQQDIIHFEESCIFSAMEYFQDRFELLCMMYGATALYRLRKAISRAEAAIRPDALAYRKKVELLDQARGRADPLVREVMLSAATKCAIEHQQYDEARSLLGQVDLTVRPSPSNAERCQHRPQQPAGGRGHARSCRC